MADLDQLVSMRAAPDVALRQTPGESWSCGFDYGLLFDFYPQPVWIFDRATLRFLTVNEAAVRQYGYARDEFGRMSITQLHPPEDRSALLAHQATYSGVAGEEPSPTGYWRHQKKDGARMDVEIFQGRTIFEGKDAELVIVNDVTARRHAERHLALQHEITKIFAESRTMQAAAPQLLGAICRSLGWQFGALWRTDPEWNAMKCVATWRGADASLERFEEITRGIVAVRSEGLPGEVWEQGIPIWIPDASIYPARPRTADAQRAGLRSVLGIPILLHGLVLGVMEFASRVTQIPDPSLSRVLGTLGAQVGHYLDRLQAEQEREEQSRLAQLNAEVTNALVACDSLDASLERCAEALVVHLEAAFAGVWTLSKEGSHLTLRAGAGQCTQLGTMHETVPIGNDNIGLIAEERRPRLVNRALEGGDGFLEACDEESMAFAGYPLIVDDQVMGVLAMFSSHSLGKSALDALHLAAQEIALGVERTQLGTQLAQAQKLESIGQLAAGVAHEINTPIQYIGDNACFLQDAFAELTPVLELDRLSGEHRADADYLCGEIPKALAQLLEGVDHVGRIVRAMKEFSHPGSLQKTNIDLNRAIRSTIVVSRNEWKYVANMIEDLDPDLPAVSCLPGEINQVLLNLIVNAAHAIADAIREGDKGTITVSTRRDGNDVEIRVRDTGTGIPEAIRAKIFDPFFTTKEVGKGTGQGLSIAHAVIVKNHKGAIHFETEMGSGSAFIVRLPIAGA